MTRMFGGGGVAPRDGGRLVQGARREIMVDGGMIGAPAGASR
jgi:hypothetical protein